MEEINDRCPVCRRIVWNKEIIAQIDFPKHSRLKTRLEVLEELKKALYK